MLTSREHLIAQGSFPLRGGALWERQSPRSELKTETEKREKGYYLGCMGFAPEPGVARAAGLPPSPPTRKFYYETLRLEARGQKYCQMTTILL